MGASPTYKIVLKRNHNAIYAIFDMPPTLERAQRWLEKYNAKMWDDKTVQREDLEIIEPQKQSAQPRKPLRRRGMELPNEEAA